MSASTRMSNGIPSSRLASSRPLARLSVARMSGGLEREGSLATRGKGAALQRHQLLDAGGGEREHLVEAPALKRRLFSRALDFDEGTGAGHDDVHVDLRARVFDVVQI